MKDFLIVGLGGFIGTAGRYGIFLMTTKVLAEKAYYGTLTVNLLGCLLIGVLSGALIKSNAQTSLFLMAGFCGGFTTFSSFALDGIKLLKTGLIGQFLIYSSISMIGGLLLCLAGFYLVNKA